MEKIKTNNLDNRKAKSLNSRYSISKYKHKAIKQSSKKFKKVYDNVRKIHSLKHTSSSVFTCEPSKFRGKSNILEENDNFNSLYNVEPVAVTTSQYNVDKPEKQSSEMGKVFPSKSPIIKLSMKNTNDQLSSLQAHFQLKNDAKLNMESNLLSSFVCVENKSCGKARTDFNVANKKISGLQEKDLSPKKDSILSRKYNSKRIDYIAKHNSGIFVSFDIHSRNSEDIIVTVYPLNGFKFLCAMKPRRCMFFMGVVELELLKGSLEVLGFNITETQKKFLVYSLQGSSHLYLKTKNEWVGFEVGDSKKLFERLVSLGLPENNASKILEDESNTLFVVNRDLNHKSSAVWPIFIDSHLSYSLLPPAELMQKSSQYYSFEQKIGCTFEESLYNLGYKEFNELSEWLVIENAILRHEDTYLPKVVLCGGKSVGKSTLLRYLVNKSLQRWEQVLVLDFDLGQCEFTLPGCISITLVKEPLLGPNYSHLKEPLKSVYLGEVDVTKCPESYIEGCCMLIEYAKKEQGAIPLFINTMGFTSGFGVTLTCGIIKAVNPSHVVEIESKNKKLNFPSHIDPGFVCHMNTEAFRVESRSLEYKLFTVPSASEISSPNSRGLSSVEARKLVILSYLSEMLCLDKLHLSEVVPYMISMDFVDLKTTTKHSLTKNQIASAMNGNLIGLCTWKKSDLFPNCLGFGVVRGIDWSTNIMYVITPMPMKSLDRVNCLLKGNITLPESLYCDQGQVEGHIPYLAFTSCSTTARFVKSDLRNRPSFPT